MKIYNVLTASLLWVAVVQSASLVQVVPYSRARSCGRGFLLKTLYGATAVTEPVLIDLVNSHAFRRLKHINQYGAVAQVPLQPQYTRYEHSLGVFFLTRQYGATLAEQVSAMLHDASHTIFSHVGDALFQSDYRKTGGDSYQDTIHEWYLRKTGVTDILVRHGLGDACSSQNKKAAKQFGLISLRLSESRWGSAWGCWVDQHAAAALRRARDLRLITTDDIHFGTDPVIWKRLVESGDAVIQEHVRLLKGPVLQKNTGGTSQQATRFYGKFSGTDPLVETEGNFLVQLSELDASYKKEFNRVKALVHGGWELQL